VVGVIGYTMLRRRRTRLKKNFCLFSTVRPLRQRSDRVRVSEVQVSDVMPPSPDFVLPLGKATFSITSPRYPSRIMFPKIASPYCCRSLDRRSIIISADDADDRSRSGFTTTSCLGNSDTYLGIPFHASRPEIHRYGATSQRKHSNGSMGSLAGRTITSSMPLGRSRNIITS
jgi:hypothetical protein